MINSTICKSQAALQAWIFVSLFAFASFFVGLYPDKLSASDLSGSRIVNVTPAEASKMLVGRKDLILIDVRTTRERSYGFIKGAQHIDMEAIYHNNHGLAPEEPVLLYCAVGRRSDLAARLLQRQGIKEIYNLSGGIEGWYRAGFDISRNK